MVKFNPLSCVVCVFFWTYSLCDAGSAEERRCHRVQREFFHKRIGTSTDPVPDNPIYDPNISICFNALKEPNRKSCCSRESELKYVTASEKYIKNSIRTKNGPLKKLVMDHITTYEERIHNLLVMSENSTRQLLSDIYRIPRTEFHEPVHDFYREVKHYMKQKQVSLYGTVSGFFDRIFPAVYKNSVNDGNIIELTEQHWNCLKTKRPEISPAPFGYLPYNISHDLHKALSVGKSYLDVLSLIVEAINTTDHLAISEKCKEQTTQLQFCSHCERYVDIHPCKGFCLNVMTGCLSQLSSLTKDWEGLITSVARLEGGMNRKYDIEKVVGSINQRIDEAVMFAMENHHSYVQSMKDLCNYEVKTKSPEQLLRSGSHTQGHRRSKRHQAPLNKRSLSVGDDRLYEQFLEVMKQLLSSAKMFDQISRDICDQELFYEQDMTSTQCWNGTTVGRYTPMVEDLSTFAKAVNMDTDPKIAILEEKLHLMKLNVQTRLNDERDERMFSDADSVLDAYGSGSSLWPNNRLAAHTDDEDLDGSGDRGSGGYGVEGSGTGEEESSSVIPYNPNTSPTDGIGFDEQNRRNLNGASFVTPTASLLIVIVTALFL